MNGFYMTRLNTNKRGFTLVELMVVVAILGALAGLVLFSMQSSTDFAAKTTTNETLRTLRDAIKGSGGKPGYFDDIGIASDFKLDDLIVNPFAVNNHLYTYDPVTRKGWRGPYVSYPNIKPVDSAGHAIPTISDFPLLDGWGHEIILQRKSSTDYTKLRLVSGGQERGVEINILYTSDPTDPDYVNHPVTDDIVVPLTKDGVKW